MPINEGEYNYKLLFTLPLADLCKRLGRTKSDQILWIFCKNSSSYFPLALNSTFNFAQKNTLLSVRYSGGILFSSVRYFNSLSTLCRTTSLSSTVTCWNTLSSRGIWKSSRISCDIRPIVRQRVGLTWSSTGVETTESMSLLMSILGGGEPPPW